MSFKPQMLRREEFLTSPSTFDYVNIASQNKQLHIEAGSLCFTYCQVPVVYSLSARNHLQITMQDGSTRAFEGLSLDADTSHKVFQRSGAVTQITVFVDTAMLK
jgi:primosomal replication protein N